MGNVGPEAIRAMSRRTRPGGKKAEIDGTVRSERMDPSGFAKNTFPPSNGFASHYGGEPKSVSLREKNPPPREGAGRAGS